MVSNSRLNEEVTVSRLRTSYVTVAGCWKRTNQVRGIGDRRRYIRSSLTLSFSIFAKGGAFEHRIVMFQLHFKSAALMFMIKTNFDDGAGQYHVKT